MKIIKGGKSPKDSEEGGPKAREKAPPKPGAGGSEIEKLKSAVDSLGKSYMEAMKEIGKMKSRVSDLPDKSQLEEIKKLIIEKSGKLPEPQGDLRKLEARTKAIESRLEALKGLETMKPAPKADLNIEKLRGAVDSLSTSLSEAKKELNGLKAKTANLPDRSQLEEIKKGLSGKGDISGLSMDEIKYMKDSISKTGYLERQVTDLKSKLDDMVNVIELFSSKINSIHKDFLEIKSRASGEPGKQPRTPEIADLRSRISEMEGVLEQMSGRLKEFSAAKGEPREMKAVVDKVSSLERAINGIRERVRQMGDDMAKPREAAETGAGSKATGTLLEAMDSRISGVNDKILKLAEDAQKLSEYFLDGMRRMESRVRAIEMEEKAEKTFPAITTPAIARARAYPEPIEEPEDESEREDVPAPYFSRPSRQGLKPAPFAPTAKQAAIPKPPIPSSRLPPPPLAPPKPPSNMFTRLRENTVVRIPKPEPLPPDEQEDLQVLTEHIMEGLRRRETREKIARDLLNAGFDEKLVSRAFMQVRTL